MANEGVLALALIAPGLDGGLAARLLAEQGIEVQAIHFRTGFARPAPSLHRFGFPVATVDVGLRYLREVVAKPRFGGGDGGNPCADCKVFLLKRAAEEAAARGAAFVCTGEVLGQDARSQRRDWLGRAEGLAGLAGRVLRPLSARLLPPTEAEVLGDVDRSRLERTHGRRREIQVALAARFGLKETAASAGGCCRLPEPAFAARVRDLLAHRRLEEVAPEDVAVLHLGRHFRLSHATKAVVARNEREGEALLALAGEERFTAQAGHGAIVWMEGEPDGEAGERAAALAARYGGRSAGPTEVVLRRGAVERRVLARPADDAWLAAHRLGGL